jgi:hypothetical protein
MTLTTERVPSGRRGAALVALVLVAVIGVLIARPWDPRPSPSPVAIVSPSPAGSAAMPEPTRVFVLPTPDLAPPGAGGEAAIVTPADVAVVQCEYGRNRGERRQLASLEVQPPMVLLDPGSSTRHISRIGWRFDVETNRLQNIFDRAWRPSHTSAWQVAPASSTRPAAFNPLRSRFGGSDEPDMTAVRVRMVIEWYTRNDEVAGRAELVPHTYREGNAEFDGQWEPFCRALL